MLRGIRWCVHDRTRALECAQIGQASPTCVPRARHSRRRKCPPLGAPPWRFSDVPALYYRCSLDPAAMAALGGHTPGTPASSSQTNGAVASRAGDATPCSALQDRLRWAPLMSKAEATYTMICTKRARKKFNMYSHPICGRTSAAAWTWAIAPRASEILNESGCNPNKWECVPVGREAE